MARILGDPRHKALRAFLVQQRKQAGLRQIDLAKRLGRGQYYVSHIETGQKVVDVIELLDWAAACGFDAGKALKALRRNGRHAIRTRPQHG
jgi:transcriptional regulator with XRE-family HTH domain